jgi:c-di-GMP-binding flagellar brake protein YcgR
MSTVNSRSSAIRKGPGMEQAQNLNSSDRRYIPRWEVNNKILYKKAADAVYKEARSKDISCCGACLCVDERLSPKERLTLEIHLNDEIAFSIEGKALWNSQLGESFLAGITFSNVSPRTQELILEYAFSFKPKAMIDHWFKGWS